MSLPTAPLNLLSGLRIIEFASFVAGPSGGMTLAQLGADVIRIDPLGGAADYRRWPISQRSDDSLYWTALNRGKRSILVDVRSPEGRELVLALATASGRDSGVLIDNNPGAAWLNYDALAARRPDAIRVHIQGHADGRPAVDYTVNAEVGVPQITGPENHSGPVNHALPAWDLLTGLTATTGLLAALRQRDLTGKGSELKLALADVALAGVVNMGWLAEADELQTSRPRVGNYLYGSFGVDFDTEDGGRVMVIALTPRQWSALADTTGTAEVFAVMGDALGVDFSDESARYVHREVITAVLRPWFEARPTAEVAEKLDAAGALWSRYRTLAETVTEHRSSREDSVLTDVEQKGIGRVISARSPLRLGNTYGATGAAPILGEHTDDVLEEILGLTSAEIGRLHDTGTIGSQS